MWVDDWSGFCMGTDEDPSLRFFATMHVKGQVFQRTFSDSSWQNLSLHPHCQDILQSTSYQIKDFLSFFFFFEVVYWPCYLKCVYPMINLAFSWVGISVKAKLPARFCVHIFERFWLQISCDAKYFLSCPRHCDRVLIVVRAYYFQIWNKQKNTTLLVVVICSHIDPIYIETLCIMEIY